MKNLLPIIATQETADMLSSMLSWFSTRGPRRRAVTRRGMPISDEIAGSSVVRLRIGGTGIAGVIISNEWICCRSWNGTDEGTVDRFVWRGPNLSNVSGSVSYTFDDATTMSITYAGGGGPQTRTATVTAPVGLSAQTEIIWPPYKAGDEIFAVEPDGGIGGTPPVSGDFSMVDLNVAGRAWVWRRT